MEIFEPFFYCPAHSKILRERRPAPEPLKIRCGAVHKKPKAIYLLAFAFFFCFSKIFFKSRASNIAWELLKYNCFSMSPVFFSTLRIYHFRMCLEVLEFIASSIFCVDFSN